MAKLAANVYSEALFELALEENRIDELQAELEGVCSLVEQDPDFREFLATPKIGKEEKIALVDAVFGGKVSLEILNFMKVLIDKKRTGELLGIRREFEKSVLEHKSMVKATAETAVPLNASEMALLKEQLSKLTGKQIELVNAINPGVIGGVRLRVGDRVIDGSLKRRLEDLREDLAQLIV